MKIEPYEIPIIIMIIIGISMTALNLFLIANYIWSKHRIQDDSVIIRYGENGNIKISGRDGHKGASGGDVTIGPGTYKGGLTIKGGDAK